MAREPNAEEMAILDELMNEGLSAPPPSAAAATPPSAAAAAPLSAAAPPAPPSAPSGPQAEASVELDDGLLRRLIAHGVKTDRKLSYIIAMLKKTKRSEPVPQEEQPVAVKKRKPAAPRDPAAAALRAGLFVPPAVPTGLFLHVRVLLETPTAFVATVLNDRRSRSGDWSVSETTLTQRFVHIDKLQVVTDLFANHNVDMTRVFRVAATQSTRDHGLKTLHGIHSCLPTRTEDGGDSFVRRVRSPRSNKKTSTYHIKVVSMELVRDSIFDLADVCHYVATNIKPDMPRMVGEDDTSYATRCGVMLPLDVAGVRQALSDAGLEDKRALFVIAAMRCRADGLVRVAKDPRFRDLLANIPVLGGPLRSFLRQARMLSAQPASDFTEVMPFSAKGVALTGFSIPVLLGPGDAAPTGLTRHMPNLLTGLWQPMRSRNRERYPSVVAVSVAGAPTVVAHIIDFFFTACDQSRLPEDDQALLHQSVEPTLQWTETFANRLESVAFDGDLVWSDDNLRVALSLAKQVTWVFRAPGGPAASALRGRLSV
jgi:hypothetical protein